MKVCNNCHAENSDSSQFCSHCGSNLENNSYSPSPYSQSTYGNQQYATYQNTYRPIPTPKATKGKVTAALVLSILFGGVIGLVFSILAFVAYGDYETAVAQNNLQLAQDKCSKINTYNKIAWIFIILGIIMSILGIIFFAAVFIFAGTVDPEFFLDEFDLSYSALSIINNII